MISLQNANGAAHLVPVPADVPVNPGGHVGADHLVVVLQAEGRHQPVVLAEQVLLVVAATPGVQVRICSALRGLTSLRCRTPSRAE